MTEPYPYAPEWDELLSMADAIRMKLLGLRWASNHAPLNDRQVFLCWADPEDISEYPAVGIMAGIYFFFKAFPDGLRVLRV